MLQNLLKNVPEILEDSFSYYEIHSKYDVTISQVPAGTQLSPHTHPRDVYNYVFEGNVSFKIGGEKTDLETGQWIQIPADKQHSLETKKGAFLLEFWRK